MIRCRSIYYFSISILLFSFTLVRAEEFKDFSELNLEELLNTAVYSASKREQKISESPNAIYVITAEDIKRSGAVDLPDLFRMAPGVDVVSVNGNSYGVSARGFNEQFARRMLVLIDGRSIYTSLFGGVFWENEQVFLEDIERIEVIRGPGATLWGANAVNGVINIITKDPEKGEGLMLTGKVGTKQFREGVSRYSGKVSDKLSLSVTGGYREDQGTGGVNDFREVPKATARIKYKLSDNSILQFFTGFNESKIGLDVSRFSNRTDSDVRSNYQILRWENTISETSQFHVQFYHDYFNGLSDDRQIDIEEQKYFVELEHTFAVGNRHRIIWGAHYRATSVDSGFFKPKTDHDDVKGFFAQDEVRILDHLKCTLGIKYEENSFTGGDLSPRGCLLYTPTPDHCFRLAVSRAFRTPSFGENNFNFVKTFPAPLSRLPLLLAVGSQATDNEKMTAYELGYRTILLHKIGLNIELYYNELDDVIENFTKRSRWPFVIGWDNTGTAIARGVEISADLPLTPWWQLKANYTFQEVKFRKTDEDYPGVPKHKFNLISSFTFKNGFSLDMRAHYVDETTWRGLYENVSIDDYVLLDVRISQKLFNDKLELALVGQNLTDKGHPETSDGTATYNSDRLIYGQMTWYFR